MVVEKTSSGCQILLSSLCFALICFDCVLLGLVCVWVFCFLSTEGKWLVCFGYWVREAKMISLVG